MEEAFPLQTNTFASRHRVAEIATRLEEELGEEQSSFVEGIPLIWGQMPDPAPPVTVGIDGGYIHARNGDNRKSGWFEVIVGKSLSEVGDNKRFAFVNKYDEKPKRRLVETLKRHGFSMRQTITFLSDGGDSVRNIQKQIAPFAEHILD